MLQRCDLDQLKKKRSNVNLVLSGKNDPQTSNTYSRYKCEPISDCRRRVQDVAPNITINKIAHHLSHCFLQLYRQSFSKSCIKFNPTFFTGFHHEFSHKFSLCMVTGQGPFRLSYSRFLVGIKIQACRPVDTKNESVWSIPYMYSQTRQYK